MKLKTKNLFLIGIITISVIFISCNKDENSSNPTVEINPYASDTGTFTDSRDDKAYKWVKIGNQIWMSENLAYIGSDIYYIADNDEWKNNTFYDGCCYFNNSSSLGKIYGVLYQWEAAKKACPDGWHLPTDAEWTTLTDYLGGDTIAGGKMKEIGTTHWNSPNTGADNSSGFSALPGGDRIDYDGYFDYFGTDGIWWCATELNNNSAYYRCLDFDTAGVYRYEDNNKLFGFSVRCVKD